MPELSSHTVSLDTQEPPPLTFSRWVAGVVLRWRLAVATGLVVLVLAALSLVLIPPSYRSSASFVANSSTASRISAAGALGGGVLGGLASQLGISAMSDPSESPAFYDRLLHSRELLTRLLLSKFPDPRPNTRADSVTLLSVMNPPGRDTRRRLEAGVKLLNNALVTEVDVKTNIVSLRYDSRWPDLSAAVVNRAVALVSDFNREQRTETIRSKRLFLEDRLAQARADLEQAEDALRFFYEENRARMSPTLAFREQQLQRRVDVASDLFLALQREYDSARLNEFSSAALVTVLDSGIPARKPQWPRYGLLFATALLVGGIAGLGVAGGASVLDDWRRRNPDVATSFGDALRRARREMGSTLRRGRSRAAHERRVA